MHWAERYVGEPYEMGVNDCAALAERVLRDVFHRPIDLPSDRAPGLRGISQQIELHRRNYAARVANPCEGDGVLMIGRGRLNHIGIFCRINKVPYVLHAMRDAGAVCLHRIRDLPSLGLQVEGFYQWIDPNDKRASA